MFTIDPLPSGAQDGSTAFQHLNASPDFTLDWDPEPNLKTEGAACSGEGCPTQAVPNDATKAVASLR